MGEGVEQWSPGDEVVINTALVPAPRKLVFQIRISAINTGRFFSSGASRKWVSIACAPESRRSKPFIPIASAIGKPTADHSE